MDRRAIAGWSLAAMQVRCLGTMGGCLGIVAGALVGVILAGAATHDALATVPGLMVGAFIGLWVGIFIALKLMAR